MRQDDALVVLGLLDTPTEGPICSKTDPSRTCSAGERARIRNRRIGFIFQRSISSAT